MEKIKIYHNPRCSKSRKTLEILLQNGHKPKVVKYLESPPSIDEIKLVLSLLKMSPQELMRENETDYKENNMGDSALTKADLIQLMHDHPKVIERPIVIHNSKAIIGRPPESVLDII